MYIKERPLVKTGKEGCCVHVSKEHIIQVNIPVSYVGKTFYSEKKTVSKGVLSTGLKHDCVHTFRRNILVCANSLPEDREKRIL